MNEQGDAEFFGLGPDRMKFWVGKFDAVHDAADRCTLQALLLHRGFKLLDREIRRLQREGSEGCEPIGLGGAEFGQFLVLDLNNLPSEIALAVIPEGIDRQHFHVDGLRIHGSEPLVDLDKRLLGAIDRRQLVPGGVGAEQGAGFAEMAV